MTWIDALPQAATALALIFLPGMAVLSAWRIRPLVLVSSSAATSVLLFTASAIGAQYADATWNVWWVLGFTAAFAILGLGVSARTKGSWRHWTDASEWRQIGSYAFGTAIAAFFFLTPMLNGLISPKAFSQTYDNGLHLNAAHMVATGRGASPFEFGLVGHPAFYPAGWHEWAGLTAQLTSGDAVVAVQVCSVVLSLIVWPCSLVWLFETVFPATRFGRMALGALSLAWAPLTFGLLSWGTLYPNFLGMATMPAAVAAGWELLGLSKRPKLGMSSSLFILILSFAGSMLAHPNAAFTAGLFLVLPALWSVIRPGSAFTKNPYLMPAKRDNKIWACLVVIAVAVFLAAWYMASMRTKYPWGRIISLKQAGLEAVLSTSLTLPPNLILTLFAIVGAVAILRRKLLWPVLAAHFSIVFVYFVGASFPNSVFRDLVSGLYYNDFRRPAAAIATFLLPIAAFGIQQTAKLLSHQLAKHLKIGTAVSVIASVLVCLAIGFYSSRSGATQQQVAATIHTYSMNKDSDFITPDEYALIERLPQHVPADVKVVNNPWDGSGWIYTFVDRMPMTIFYQRDWPNDQYLINQELENVATKPEVCGALHAENAQYVLQLEEPFTKFGQDHKTFYEGLDEIAERPGFEVIDSEGEAKLYKITACSFN